MRTVEHVTPWHARAHRDKRSGVQNLDGVNDAFHDAYAAARRKHEAAAPVLVLLADELVIRCRGERRAHVVRPPAFHAIKSVSHAPVALYAFARAGRDDVDALRRRIDGADLGAITDPEARRDCEETLRRTEAAIAVAGAGSFDLGTFASSIGPLLLKLTLHATAIHLSALDAAVEEELARMSHEEKACLQVVVTGDHQARSRSLGMQYFAKRLAQGSPDGERVLYAEGITAEDEAVALVALQRLDREVAGAFFGDSRRLQSDVLGGAAAQLLADGDYATIE